MRGASFPSRRLREKRRNDGERWAEGTAAIHLAMPSNLSSFRPTFDLFIIEHNCAEYRFLSSPFPCNLSIKIFLNIIPSIALEIPRSPFQEPSKTLLSKFPSFRAQIGHLFHPSTISSFPICHARCVVSFSSPIATLLDRRAGHERRRSSLEEEKGDSGKRDEMWSVGTRRKERHVLNESLAGTCSVPKKGRKGRKGRVRKDEVKCNRKHARYLGRVWFFHTGFLPWLLYKQELSD